MCVYTWEEYTYNFRLSGCEYTMYTDWYTQILVIPATMSLNSHPGGHLPKLDATSLYKANVIWCCQSKIAVYEGMCECVGLVCVYVSVHMYM